MALMCSHWAGKHKHPNHITFPVPGNAWSEIPRELPRQEPGSDTGDQVEVRAAVGGDVMEERSTVQQHGLGDHQHARGTGKG